MYFSILFVCGLFVGILGQDILDKQKSDIYIPAENFTGDWYLLYWGQPSDNEFYSKDVLCVRSWGSKINENQVKFEEVVIYQNSSQINYDVDLTIISYPENKYVYKVILNGKEIIYKYIEFDKFRYGMGHSFDEKGKEYLFVFGKDPTELRRNRDKIHHWKKGTKNQMFPSYKINPEKCLYATPVEYMDDGVIKGFCL